MTPFYRHISRAFMIGTLAFAPLALTACDDDGPAEDVGEKVDEGAQDTKRAIEDATE